MIRKLIGKILKLPRRHGGGQVVTSYKQHGIHRDQLSRAAQKVCDQLQASGFQAYVVGGAVRDLLLGQAPKDFDVATNATPDEVHKLFRRARIIGRRFRIVHVPFGDEIIEVTTFRGDGETVTDDAGRIIRDNSFGSLEDDAKRRDFTVNALFYDPARQEILDYHHGVRDIQKKQMTMIGPPALRYREDPVRMLRAVRLSAKLGLEIEPHTRAPIKELAPLLANVPSSRLFDEMLKLLFSGYSWAGLLQLRQEGLHHHFFPLLDRILDTEQGSRFLQLALEATDQRIRQDKPVSAGYLFAGLLWQEVQAQWKTIEQQGGKHWPALFSAVEEVLAQQEKKLSIPRRYSAITREIWTLQPRFEQRSGARPFKLLEQPRFRAAYDFLCLRAESGEAPKELAEWWTRFQRADVAEREAMLVRDEPVGGAAKRRRPRKRKPTVGAGSE